MSIYTPYTYLLHHIPTNTFYYGVRWKNVKLMKTPEEDLWIKYFSRSKKVHHLIDKYGLNSFEFEIRKKFDTVEQARDWETKVLHRMDVLNKPSVWLNRTNNKAILNDTHPRGTLGKTWKNPRSTESNKINKVGNTNTKGTYWVHCGTEKRMIPIGEPMPIGFKKGTGRTNKRPDLAERNRKKGK